MKSLIILILCSVFLFGKVADISEDDLKQSANLYSYSNAKVILKNLEEDFKASTGDDKFQEYLEKASLDENWRIANYIFAFKLVSTKTNLKKGKTYKMQDYETALEYFAKSVQESNNLLAAYQGFRIIEKYFLYMTRKNAITDKYLETFVKPLFEKNYCVGALYYGRLFTQAYGHADYLKAQKVFQFAKENCIKNENEYYLKGIKKELAKVNTIIKIKKGEIK